MGIRSSLFCSGEAAERAERDAQAVSNSPWGSCNGECAQMAAVGSYCCTECFYSVLRILDRMLYGSPGVPRYSNFGYSPADVYNARRNEELLAELELALGLVRAPATRVPVTSSPGEQQESPSPECQPRAGG